MRVIDRLQQYLVYKNINHRIFERSCQVANGYLKKQQKGKGSIGSEILERIYRHYFDLNLIWLITGDGNMLQEGGTGNENIVREPQPFYSKDSHIKFLGESIRLLESSLADKEKIILMLEEQLRKSKTG